MTTLGLHTIVCIVWKGLDYRPGFARLWVASTLTWYAVALVVNVDAIRSWSGFHYRLLKNEGSIGAALEEKHEMRNTRSACYAAREALCVASTAPVPSDAERAAQIAELANRTGLPYDVVARNFERERQRSASRLVSGPEDQYDEALRRMFPFLPAYVEGCEQSEAFLEALRREATTRGAASADSTVDGSACRDLYGLNIPYLRPEAIGILLVPLLPIGLYFPISWIARGFAKQDP